MQESGDVGGQRHLAATENGQRRAGEIAARIDRLPVGWIQYGLASITQLFWGIIIANDGLAGKIYPFVWAPHHTLSPGQFNVILLFNIGIGITAGEYVGGYLSDRYGRKKILLLSALIDGIFLWPMALTNAFGWLILWNFLYAIGMGMVLGTNAVYLHEIVPPQARQSMAMRTQIIAIVVYLLLPGLLAFYWIPSHYQWVIFALAAAPILILIPVGGLLLPESPRWLEARGYHDKAHRIVSRWEAIAERRHGPLPSARTERHPVIITRKVPLRELLRSTYGRRTVILWVCWFFNYVGMTYGYITYAPTYLAGKGWSAHEVFLVTTIIAAPVTAATFTVVSFLQERVERRTVAMVGGLLAAAAFLLLLVVEGNTGVAILVIIASPIGQTLWLFTMYNYTAAAYPTRLRSVGTGWTDGVGHLGALVTPVIAGPLLFSTMANGAYGWLLWLAIPGAALPALLIGFAGIRQRGEVLEQLAT